MTGEKKNTVGWLVVIRSERKTLLLVASITKEGW